MSIPRNAVITGSTSGIGLGIATAFAAEGLNVMLNGFGDADEIEKTRAGLEENHGVKVLYNGADMTKPEEIRNLISETESAFGSVDVLVNNAGIQHVSPVEEFPEAKWDAIIAINLSSAFHTTKAVFTAMKKRGFGRIINVASAHALVASPFKSAYVAAKHGVLGLTKAVALEGAEHGVTCNAICPGYVKTPLVEAQIPDTAKARNMSEEEVVQKVILEAQPTKKFVTVEQVGALAAFLASDNAASITGAAYQIDGGWVAK
ncbi:3-hydroxybutyrate dehydrogenase [Hyphococcus flavus]|uniref:3-hydroxybutyrate dehydrogenase n=1 Tax=Hyphococcus flavus TaxID=1866326 RepID=A0AAE9ZBQ2_9PROT|nr:3-hydroxybutyrate dehydrogenase [Hyphococcus flavus]WDI31201.1 3-hydroxybutyrate dehydrogenase [Hyphococcus flavus]